jgi:hypothetical protein
MQVFLSYAHPDTALAEALAAYLEKRGFSVWNPQAEVMPGDNVWMRNGEALEKSHAMVVLISPESMRSEWVRREIEYALGHERYEGKLFPVQVKATSSMPWILGKFKILDASQGFKKVGDSIADALKQAA